MNDGAGCRPPRHGIIDPPRDRPGGTLTRATDQRADPHRARPPPRLDRQGIFTTGLLLEVSETPTRRQTLADQVDATTNDVLMWRDEALMLNLASFGPVEHQLMIQAGIEGLRQILDLDLDAFRARVRVGAAELKVDPPSDLTIEGWWDQARTLEDE